MSRVVLVVLLALALLAPAGALAQQDLLLPSDPQSQGQPDTGSAQVDDAVAALRSDSVWVDPDNAADVSPGEADEIRTAIREDGGGINVAVFPPGVGEPDLLAQQIARALGRSGVYVVIAGPEGRSIGAGSTDSSTGLGQGEAPALAQASADTSSDGGQILMDFVGDVAAARDDGGIANGSDVSGSREAAFALLAVVILGGGAVFFFRRRAVRHQERTEIEQVRGVADEDLVALGDDIRALDLDIEMPGVDPRAKVDYGRALEAHSSANVALRTAKRPEDFEPIAHTLEQGRYAMESAKARLEGREPPEHRAPCFFDPRHGPSTRDVEWAPEWGEPRMVPACEADAVRIESGHEPMAREIEVAGYGRTPYWNAPAYYGPYAGGFYGGFGGTGLLTGMLAGSLLTSMWAAPMAYGAGWGDGGWGGDAGGGDWGGGGDFGGGDFGGGGDF